MKPDEQTAPTGFYFALPRLLHRWRGGTDEVSENSAAEAYLGSSAIFAITYIAAWPLCTRGLVGWAMIITAILLVFVVWIFWLLVLFLNSLAIKALRHLGFFRQTSNRAAQDIIIGVIVAVFAVQLSISRGWTRPLGILFLVLLAANVVAASFLFLRRPET